jgi:hypothetical protein
MPVKPDDPKGGYKKANKKNTDIDGTTYTEKNLTKKIKMKK